MTDVVITSQIINRKITFKVYNIRRIYIFRKTGFISIYKICSCIYCLSYFKKCIRCKNIIIVQQSNIFTVCKLNSCITVAYNTLIRNKFFVPYSTIVTVLNHFFYVRELVCTAVSKAKLPVAIGLR